VEDGIIHGKVPGGFCGAEICFPKVSVGATENVILAAVLAQGKTGIYGAAKEPEVVELCRYLVKCGAHIKGIGTDVIIIEGVQELQGCCIRMPPDRIVAGTYLFAVLAAGGSAWLEEAPCEQMQSVLKVARQMGAVCQESWDGLYVQAPAVLKPIHCVQTGEYPEFPTDLQSMVAVAALRAKGNSVIEETIFENRFHIVEPLKTMGADIHILDSKRILVKGGLRLCGKRVEAKELRGGAAMVLAGLMADGITYINGCEYIRRGYENIGKDLRELGARVVSV
jgi:UDP-N-acetylglucosamine 1-carboxyvinyltransferase